MKKQFWTVLSAAFCALFAGTFFAASTQAADGDSFKVMSFNVRCFAPDGENHWDLRKETLVDVIKADAPLFLGVQEATWTQMEYLNKNLAGYEYIGVGRDDGEKAGEFMAIFYQKDAVELLDSGTFWLSKTPDKPSKGWDAACFRTATWGEFKIKSCGATVVYVNTHLDHRGTIARKEAAKLMLRKTAEINKGGEFPIFISGDFNVTETSEAYKTITEGVDGIPGLLDTNKVAKNREIAQPRTFHGWGSIPVEKGSIIDFIFVNDRVEVENFKINPDKHENGRYPSDHNSIIATLKIK